MFGNDSFKLNDYRRTFKILFMTGISEKEFARICRGIAEDAETICEHNPIGTREETLLWMLLSVLVSYLSLSEIETPCFTGKPTAETYRQAILFVLRERKTEAFDAEFYIDEMLAQKQPA
jgi:hypothetical protein